MTKHNPKHKQDDGLIRNMSYSEIMSLVDINKPVRKAEKNQFGEVFTPLKLINDMLNQLPHNIWSNPHLKWLDPACGIGNFPIVIFARLDDGLRKKIPNANNRKSHIIRNMLFMVELNKTNYNEARKIFGRDANIFNGSFLEDGWQKLFGVNNHYDVAVGNPPYNQGGTRIGGNVFWKQFIFHSLDVLSPNGYICFVHPLGWRKPKKGKASAGDVWDRYKQGHLVYLNMDNSTRYKTNGFPTVDFYVWKNGTSSERKTIVDASFDKLHYNGKLDLSSLPFIPSYIDPSVINIIKKFKHIPEKDRLSVIHTQAFKASSKDTRKKRVTKRNTRKKWKGDDGCIPYAHLYDHSKADYIMAYKCGLKPADYVRLPKIVMTFNGAKENGRLYPVYYDGNVGTTASTMYQIVRNKSEGGKLISFLNSDLVRAILKITQFSDRPNHKNEFHILNMLPNPVHYNITLTKDELMTIKKINGA